MNKLKIAVGLKGRVLFLEKFPDDEEHYGLNDYISDIEDNVEVKESPGIYMASFHFVGDINYHGEYDSYMDIDTLEPV